MLVCQEGIIYIYINLGNEQTTIYRWSSSSNTNLHHYFPLFWCLKSHHFLSICHEFKKLRCNVSSCTTSSTSIVEPKAAAARADEAEPQRMRWREGSGEPRWTTPGMKPKLERFRVFFDHMLPSAKQPHNYRKSQFFMENPLVNQDNYGIWPFIMNFPMKNGDFP